MQQGSVGYMLRHQSSLLCVKRIHLDTNDSNLQDAMHWDVKHDRCQMYAVSWQMEELHNETDGNSSGGYFHLY